MQAEISYASTLWVPWTNRNHRLVVGFCYIQSPQQERRRIFGSDARSGLSRP